MALDPELFKQFAPRQQTEAELRDDLPEMDHPSATPTVNESVMLRRLGYTAGRMWLVINKPHWTAEDIDKALVVCKTEGEFKPNVKY